MKQDNPYESVSVALDWAQNWLKSPKLGRVLGFGQLEDSLHLKKSPHTRFNPANEKLLFSYCDSSSEDIDMAVNKAHHAFTSKDSARDHQAWSLMTRAKRRECLFAFAATIRKHRLRLAALESLSNGKTLRESFDDDLPESADVFEYYAGWIDKIQGHTNPVERGFLNMTFRESVGVCALVVPWNFPLLLACWKIAPALAMGNTAVVKPAEQTPLSLLYLLECLEQENVLPPGVLSIVLGGAQVGKELIEHPLVSKVSFTGGTDTGKAVVTSAVKDVIKPVTLELGGKSPNVLFEDTENLGGVIDRAYVAMFCHKGEKCSEPTRLIVHRSIYSKVLEGLKLRASQEVCGDPFDSKTTQGPQAFKQHFDRIQNYIQVGTNEGAKLLCGGRRTSSPSIGYFVEPTVFYDVTPNMRVFQEEIFGPVLCVSVFDTEDEAIALANSSVYGLAAGLYTANINRAIRVSRLLEAGQVFVNHYGCYDFSAPFGGFKQSGWGKEMARESLESYTRLKSVWVKWS